MILVISQPNDIGDLTTNRFWWSHNQKVLVISQPKDTGDLTTKRYWWSRNQKILVISQPKDTGDLTTKRYWWSHNQTILVISQPKDTGDLTTKRYWWSHDQAILVISQPKDTGDLTTKRYWWSHNQTILVISQPKDIADLTTKSEPHYSESASRVILVLQCLHSYPCVVAILRLSGSVQVNKRARMFTFSSLSEGAAAACTQACSWQCDNTNPSNLTNWGLLCGRQSEVWTANPFRTF
jgi:hypothetical protein